MSDPMIDAADRYIDQQEEMAQDEFEWWANHHDRVLSVFNAMIASGQHTDDTADAIIEAATMVVTAVTNRAYDNNGDWCGQSVSIEEFTRIQKAHAKDLRLLRERNTTLTGMINKLEREIYNYESGAVTVRGWKTVEHDGFPDVEEETLFLCEFDDGTIETFDFDPVLYGEEGFWGVRADEGLVVAYQEIPEREE